MAASTLRFDGRPGSRASNDYTAQVGGEVLGRFRQLRTFIAMRMPESFIVDSPQGTQVRGPGDFLIIDDINGAMYGVSASSFLTTYEKVEDIPT